MAYELGVIGGGNIGSAIVRGCIDGRVFDANSIIIADIDPAKRNEFIRMGCAASEYARNACEARRILLAVKPQAFPALSKQIEPATAGKLVISVMAGRTSQFIAEALGGRARVIRAMPNVASQIAAGMTAISLGLTASEDDADSARRIFNAIGKVIVVEEDLMHAVTAVSGSGPAYVFLLAESMEQAAIALGFDRVTARQLVSQTIFGAGRLLNESKHSAEQLRISVTSPAGTTAAALSVFASGGFNELVLKALTAARDRGRELERQ